MTRSRFLSDLHWLRSRRLAAGRTPAARFRPTVELLEQRWTPADVTGGVKLGVLRLTAVDAASAEAIILFPTTDGPGGAFTVGCQGTTTINGDATRDFFGVRSIVINLKGGDDSALLINIRLAGGVTFIGGDGANEFAVGINPNSPVPPVIGGSIRVINGNNGTGTDTVNIGAAVGGTVTVSNGPGKSTTSLSGSIGGGVRITGGPNDDTAEVRGFIGGNLRAILTSGDDTLSLQSTNLAAGLVANLGGGTNTAILEDVNAARSVRVSGGGDPDTVQLTDVWIGRTLSVGLGNGSNFFTIDDTADAVVSDVGSTISGAFTLTSGRDADFIRMGSDQPVALLGPVSLLTGDDNPGVGDTVTLDDLFVLSALLIDTGAGNDVVQLDTASTFFFTPMTLGDRVTIRLGAGDDEVDFGTDGSAATRVLFAVAPVVQGGAGTSDDLFRSNYAINGVGDALFSATGFETITLPF